MRQGFNVDDSDTHVNPAADVLDRYVDPSFRARLSELEPYRQQFGQTGSGVGKAPAVLCWNKILPTHSGHL